MTLKSGRDVNMPLRKCCSCITLRMITIFIGIFSVTLPMVITMTTIILLLNIDAAWHPTNMESINKFYIYEIFILAFLLYTVVAELFGVFMIVGTIKRKPGWIFPWLAFFLGSAVIVVCVSVAAAIVIYMIRPLTKIIAIPIMMISCTFMGTEIWHFVYSYYKEILAEKLEDRISSNKEEILTAARDAEDGQIVVAEFSKSDNSIFCVS